MSDADQRPDLLIIMSDQHSGRVLGCADDPFVQTPNLDGLAARGVRFSRTYCGNPLCVPSRMTFLTSQHSSDIDVWTNGCLLRPEIPTFLHSLATAGYETVHCGRMHFTGPDHRHGFEQHLVGDLTSQWPGTTGPDLGHIPLSTTGQSRPGLDHAGAGRTGYQAYDRAVTDSAVEFIRSRGPRAARRPFCLVVGYVLPHCPFICPRDLFEKYHDRVDIPRLAEQEKSGLHPAVQRWREARGLEDVPDDVVRTARAAYYGLTELCDALVGEVLGALDAANLADETAVFYTSDHGDMAGNHEMWWKSCFYEDSVGVPLIASWPGRFAAETVIDEPVSLLDLAPTFTDLGHGADLPRARGTSLRSFLQGDGRPADRPAHVFAEAYSGSDAPARMVCRGPWKLVHFHGYDQPQLFNVADDPGEVDDRATDPACADVRDELLGLALDGWSGERTKECVAIASERWGILGRWARATHPPEPDHWVEPEGCNVFPEA